MIERRRLGSVNPNDVGAHIPYLCEPIEIGIVINHKLAREHARSTKTDIHTRQKALLPFAFAVQNIKPFPFHLGYKGYALLVGHERLRIPNGEKICFASCNEGGQQY